ncbi:hypothetical protein SBA4_360040 [Candidatus Sulfopaludibacter sp. SbA4]|nr:hypothetical protein SBA4_360040 [Candidatus Sulfopaludibacter sp. SbA4]
MFEPDAGLRDDRVTGMRQDCFIRLRPGKVTVEKEVIDGQAGVGDPVFGEIAEAVRGTANPH